MIATRDTTTTTAVLTGRLEREKIWSGLGLGSALLISALLNLWNLAQNGYGNTYYAVAAQSMAQNWHNFFFGAYDAGGFITVDKPPVALWMQALSVKLVGFSGLALLVPEALAGVASVALLYFLVRRLFGPLAGFVAALALALTPIAVAVERSNNTDTWLMFALLLAAWALTLATEQGRFRLLALSLALVGVAFNIKMLAAFIVLPAFYLLYFVAAPIAWPRRLLHLTLGGIVLLAVALSWPLAVQLTPADQRPWVGGSPSNSVLELALDYNGLGRVTGNEQLGGRGGAPGGGFPNPGNNPGFAPGGPGGRGGGPFGGGVAGPLRLVSSALADQWSWLLPLAVLGLVAAGLALRRKLPLEPRGQALVLWSGWLLIYAAVFSAAEGIFHPYYLVMLAPATAALVGIGVAALWAAYRRGDWQAWLLPVALLLTAIWQMNVLSTYPQWSLWLTPLAFGGSVLTALPLMATRFLSERIWRRAAPGLLALGLLALLLSPLAWATTPALAVGGGNLPEAGPNLLTGRGGFGGPGAGQPGATAGSGLVSYLEAHQAGYFYLVGLSSANQASAIVLATDKPVLAMGGFMGSDPAMTVAKLQQMIAATQVRFVMGGSGGAAVSSWVQANCKVVDSSQYQGQSGGGNFFGGPGGFRGNGQLYDCAAR